MGAQRTFYLATAISLLTACGQVGSEGGLSTGISVVPGSFDVESTERASIVVSGYQPPQFATLSLNAQRRFPTNIPVENTASWTGSENWLFKLPASVVPSYGRPGNGFVYLDFKPHEGSEIRCLYKGNGTTSGGSAGSTCTSAAGTQYNFLMCMKKSDWSTSLESSCASNYAGTPACATKNLGIMDGDTVTAASASFNLASGAACVNTPSTEAKVVASLQLANFNRGCGGAALAQGSWRTLPWEPSGASANRNAQVHLLSDLKCDNVNDHTQPQPPGGYEIGAGLTVIGSAATVHGHDNRIRAKKSRIGLLVNGPNITVRDIEASDLEDAYTGDTASTGARGGAGLMAYDTQNLNVIDSTFDDNRIGVDIFGENIDIVGVTVRNNRIRDSNLVGIRMRGEHNWIVSDPIIEGNDLSNSAQAAIQLLKFTNFELTGTYLSPSAPPKNHTNIFTGSLTGFHLSGTSVVIQNYDMSGSGVKGNLVFVAGAQSVNILKSKLSSSASATPDGIRVGAHLYNVSTVYVDNLIASGGDIGLKIAIDAGVTGSRNVTVMNSDLRSNLNAGVQIQAYDSTSYGNIAIGQNNLAGYYSGYNSWYGQNVWYGAWIIPGTGASNVNLWSNIQ